MEQKSKKIRFIFFISFILIIGLFVICMSMIPKESKRDQINNLKKLTFIYKEKEYNFPCKLEKLLNNNDFEIISDCQEIPSLTTVHDIYLITDEVRVLRVSLTNDTNNSLPLKECQITNIYQHIFDVEDREDLAITLPQNHSLTNKTKITDILNDYGSDYIIAFDTDDYIEYIWFLNKHDDGYIGMTINKKSGLSDLQMGINIIKNK